MNDLPHGLTPKDLQDELDFLDSNIQVGPDITIDEYWRLVRYILRRRRRGSGAGAGLVSSIVTTPSVLVVPAGSAIGTVVGTASVINGLGTYTFSFISNPGGYFAINPSTGQITVGATLPSPQAITVVIQANNGLGDTPVFTTTITIQPTGVHPTYFIYGF